jgi:vacuolar protein sorting-associated protein 53
LSNKLKFNVQRGSEICKVVDLIDSKIKFELIKWFLKHELSEYSVLFEEAQDNAWIDKIDRRYSWIKRSLVEFTEKFDKIFPKKWEMSERLVVMWCEMTNIQLSNVMNKRKHEIDNKLFMFAIQRTISFEQFLTKHFLGITVPKNENEKDISDEEWKPFLGMISQCFDAHFDIYLTSTDATLMDLVCRFGEDAKQNGFPRATNGDFNNLHNSSADLFVFYKNCMTQCLQLFTNKNLLIKLSMTFQKYLREYSQRVLTNNLPK